MVLLCLHQTLFAVAQSNNGLKDPDTFFPHKRGEKFTPHHQLTNYFEYLAANAGSTMRLEQYGATNEDRPLKIAIFSSPENMARLEQIRINNLKMSGLAEGQPDMSNPVAIVWLSMTVHGNEPSGAECSPMLAYKLAAQTDAETKEWLRNTVVILDPTLNPDGNDRYTHWNRMASNRVKNPNADAREHREPWPGGRTNHYYFDLNRDWAWATQTETRQRLSVYQRWMPHVHADVHEQGVDDPYYFAPAAEPIHEYVTPWQRDFQTQIGKNNARYFDQNGWLYFTKEIFDLFYPSYGDTYPTFAGAIGMTYEQAGGPRGGVHVHNALGDTLTLYDRIQHHFTACVSTIEISSKNAAKLIENFRKFYQDANTKPQGPYKSYVIRESNNPNKINQLCNFLDRHQIRYGRSGIAMTGVKAFDYVAGKESSVSIGINDIVISAYQPRSVLLQVLFDPESKLNDSLTYDITAWALPYAHGLDAYAIKERIEPQKKYEPYKANTVRIAAPPYSWCIHRKSLAELQLLSALLQKGVKVRTATKPFSMADQQFAAGALVINRADNRLIINDLDQIVMEEAAKRNVSLHPVFTGFSGAGNDLGSDAFDLVAAPQAAIIYGDDVDDNAYGHTWFFMEQELEYPVTALSAERLFKVRLSNYQVLIFPNGYYTFTDKQLEALKNWISEGGRLIASDNALKSFADKDGFALKTKTSEEKKDSVALPKPFRKRERDWASGSLPGAIVKAQADNSFPLCYGFGEHYFSLKTSPEVYQMPDNAVPAIYLDDNYQSYGFIGSKVKPRLKKSPVAAVQKMGEGSVVYFVDGPLFRCFWEQGKMLFANAVFMN